MFACLLVFISFPLLLCTYVQFPPLRLKDEVSAFGTLNTVITTRAARKYDAAGYVVSSRGNVTTRVKASFAFVNTLSLSRDGLTSSISYKAATSSALSRKAADGRVLDLVKEISSFPLDMQFDTAMFPGMPLPPHPMPGPPHPRYAPPSTQVCPSLVSSPSRPLVSWEEASAALSAARRWSAGVRLRSTWGEGKYC